MVESGKGPASSLPTPPTAKGCRADKSHGQGRGDGSGEEEDGSDHSEQPQPRRWTVGPAASPTSSPVPKEDQQRQEEEEEREGTGTAREVFRGGAGGVSEKGSGAGYLREREDDSSVGDLARRFGGSARVNSDKLEWAGPEGRAGRGRGAGFVKAASDSKALASSSSATGASTVNVGKRSNSGKIAELARRFEK